MHLELATRYTAHSSPKKAADKARYAAHPSPNKTAEKATCRYAAHPSQKVALRYVCMFTTTKYTVLLRCKIKQACYHAEANVFCCKHFGECT